MEEVQAQACCSLHERVLTVLELALFALAVFGLASAVTVLKIGRYFFGTSHCEEKECQNSKHPYETRKFLGRIPYFGDLFYCPPCLGFWLGMGTSVWILSPSQELIEVWWKAMLLDGCVAVGIVWILHVAVMRMAAMEKKL